MQSAIDPSENFRLKAGLRTLFKEDEMRLRRPKETANGRLAGGIWFKLALITLVALLCVALPQMFSAHAGGGPKAPTGFLFTVTTTDDHDDSSCDGDCTLREAINAANAIASPDTIEFKVTGTINLTSALPNIIDDVEIVGPGASVLTVRRDAPLLLFRIFNVTTTGTVTFSDLTISEGSLDFDFGGGIQNSSTGTVNINNTTLTLNRAQQGAGVFNNGGIVNVTNSTIVQNSAVTGGAAGNAPGGTLTVNGSSIIANHSVVNGGGVFNDNGTVSVFNCAITNNSASHEGGGINSFSGGTVNVTDSTISGNSAFIFGGGINVGSDPNGTVNVTNSTLSGNSAKLGGGISSGFGGATVNVKSSIIALNTLNDASGFGPDVEGMFTSQGFNLIGKTDDSTGFTAPTDLTGTVASPRDPRLDPNGLQDNGGPTRTIALLCDSPAIDKGTSNGLTGNLTTDQRGSGFPRTVDDPLVLNASGGDGTDIGAFEVPLQNCNHPPVAQCKNIQVSAGSDCQASITAADVDNGSFDPDPGDSIATRTLDNSGPFGLGPHTVMLTVTDTHGASSSCSATVTVVDTAPPTITCPPNQNVPAASGQCQAVVNYPTPTISDNCSAPVFLGCTPPSGSTFQVGTTPVTCTANDAANNIGACQFQVIVVDNQPPSITCPANVTSLTDQIACPNPACQVVSYPAPVVSDNCPGVTAVCNPPAGSCFPTGVTTVTCTASDTSGNTATCSFTVTVFDVALQDDGNPGTILLWNSITGAYRFCCGGITFTGIGKATIKGCVHTLEHNPADRRVLGRVDKAVHAGSGSIQAPAGTTRCTIVDRNTADNTSACS